MEKRFLIAAILLVSCLAIWGNKFCRIRNFATDNGLLQAHISNAVQDKTGFIWFATWNGLVRYDGYTFNTFKPILNSKGTIFSNRIYNIKRSANDHGLWCVSSENRLFYFDTKTCLFTDVLAEMPTIADKRVKVLTPLAKGVTWVTFKDNSCLRLIDKDYKKGGRYLPNGKDELKGVQQIIGITQDQKGDEWILTDQGAVCMTRHLHIKGLYHFVKSVGSVILLIGKNGQVTILNDKGKATMTGVVPETVNYVTTLDNMLLMATNQGVWSYHADNNTFVQHSKETSVFLFKDSQKRIWSFGHDHRVGLLNLSAGSMTLLETEKAAIGCSMKNPQLILEDATGQVVLKPEQGVMSYYDETTQTLQTCRFFRGSQEVSYNPADISKFLVDHQRNLWILQTHAAECISFSGTTFTHWNNPKQQEARAILRDSKGVEWYTDRSLSLYQQQRGYLSSDGQWLSAPVAFTKCPAYCIYEDKRQQIWIGTKGDGLYLLTPQTADSYHVDHFLHNASDMLSLRSDTIYAILQATDGTLLLGSYGQGLSMAMRDTTGRWRFHHVKGFPANTKIRCLREAYPGIFLIGSTNGLITADLRNASSPRYYTNSFRNEEWGLKGNDIMHILHHGNSWYVCVFGSGISKIRSSQLTSDTIHFQNYLIPSTSTADQIKTAASDGKNIWLISEQAITRFSPSTGNFNIYDKSNFIGDFNFAEGQPIITAGRITAGTSKGLLTFHTDDVGSQEQQPHIVVTGIQYQNDMTIHPLNDVQQLDVSPDERSFSLYLSALDYEGQNTVRFRYRLEEFDKGWNYTGDSQHSANYSSLPPGNYLLTIQATNSKGEWTAHTRQLAVHVIPRFVETAWFKLIIILMIAAAFLGMVYAIIYLSRMRRLLQRKYSLLMTVDEFSHDIQVERKEEEHIAADEQLFMKQSIAFFEDNIGNRNFVVEDLARHLGMSRTAYYSKMKSITGLSPIDFIKQMRIKKALKLMDTSSLSITDIAYKVGFSDPKYFSKCFKAEMGMTPSQYVNNQ